MPNKSIRIGCGGAWEYDLIPPAVLMADKGELQYLCAEHLAERTLGLAQQPRRERYRVDAQVQQRPASQRGVKETVFRIQGTLNPEIGLHGQNATDAILGQPPAQSGHGREEPCPHGLHEKDAVFVCRLNHAPGLTAGHAHRTQQAQLARPLEHRQRHGDGDAEHGDHQRQQHEHDDDGQQDGEGGLRDLEERRELSCGADPGRRLSLAET